MLDSHDRKIKKNLRDAFLSYEYEVYDINYPNYSNILSVNTHPLADRCFDELNQIVKVYGTPGVARVIITLSRIML